MKLFYPETASQRQHKQNFMLLILLLGIVINVLTTRRVVNVKDKFEVGGTEIRKNIHFIKYCDIFICSILTVYSLSTVVAFSTETFVPKTGKKKQEGILMNIFEEITKHMQKFSSSL